MPQKVALAKEIKEEKKNIAVLVCGHTDTNMAVH
jgi:flagellar motor protein MotB